jgi:predicted transcriptional regulator
MPKPLTELGRRERQIMDILVRRKRASAAEVLADLPDQPSYSAVRGMLRFLEEKGYVKHEWDGPRHVYLPAGNPEQLQRAAVKHLIETFFNDSAESAVVALLGQGGKPLTPDQIERLEKLIARAKKNGGRL